MPHPVASYLMQFDLPAVRPVPEPCETSDLSPIWTSPDQQEAEFEAGLAAEREAGRAEGEATARAEAAAELERMRGEFEAQLSAERQKWAQDEAGPLKDRLASALREMEESLTDCVGRVLRPFIVASLRRQMVDELVAHIAAMVASQDTVAIRIAAPADLLALLQEQLADLPVALDYEESDGVDVCLKAEQTMIETRLKAWIDLIEAQMGERRGGR